jgi:hypothetical protein
MQDKIRDINDRYHGLLSWLFVLQVAIIAACYLVNVDGPRERSGWLIFLSFFVWPLMAAWPARSGWMLRGALTNALAIIFTIAYVMYFKVGVVADWLLLSIILAFGMVSGMAGGGLVERWRSKWQTDKPRDFSLPQQPLVFPRATALPSAESATQVHVSAWQATSQASPTYRQ